MSEFLENPKISVIIPTWNRALYVTDAINSALRQTYPPHEILVCDDGSTDNTEEIVRGIGDSRIRWISGAHAGCPAVPRNRGIAASVGDWIAFLDSDDVWLPEKLEAQLALVKKTGARAVCSNAYREVDGKIDGRLISEESPQLRFSDLVKDNKVVCSSVVVSRSVLQQTGGFPEHAALRVGEDFCLWLKVSRLTPFAYADEAFVIYKDAPATSVRAEGPSVDKQRTRAFRSFIAWRWQRNKPKALIDMLTISLINVGSRLQARYYGSRARLGMLRRCLIRRSTTLADVEPEPILWNLTGTSSVVVSVLLPVHNASTYVRRAIDSILAQTFRDFELIVIDDASTDGSAAVLDDLHDPRIVRVRFEKNRGIVDALNSALKEARGRYIARMDADDIAHPHRFQQQVEYLDRHSNTMVVGSWIQGFGDVRRRYIHRYPLDNDEIKSCMLFESPFAHPSVMIRRTALENLAQHYSPDFPYVEDWELWTRLIHLGEGANIPRPLLQYRIHAKSSSQRFTQLQGASKSKLLQKIYADVGMPFREEYVLSPPPSNAKWLKACFFYFHELLKAAEINGCLNAKVFANVLQRQLILRARQIALFGVAPAWFVFRHSLVPVPTSQRLLVALKILVLTNARALLALKPSHGGDQ